jgi:hypothetical protein
VTARASQLKQPLRPALRDEPGGDGTVSGKLTWAVRPDDRSFAIQVIVEGREAYPSGKTCREGEFG